MTETVEKRRHPRCSMDREIIFSHASQTEIYRGLARNHGRFSLYFESPTKLVPGTILFIRSVGAGSAEGSAAGNSPASAELPIERSTGGACSELKTQVVAQVRRCVEIAGSGETFYGTALEFIDPAV
jgi:hypothetical protein